MSSQSFDISVLANPEVFQINRLDPYSDHKCFANAQEAELEESSLKKSLNGKWRFHFANNLAGRSVDFFKPDFDYSAFDYIEVPGHFETQGYGRLHYTNVTYPWDGHENIIPGQVPTKYNPVGSYITTFTVPENFKNTFISFQGVDSAFACWLNGHFVGYSEDSCTPADFELTPYLKSGENTLAVQVYKYSSGSWLEDQDFFRFSGIYRDVFIYTKPEVHVQDLFVKTALFDNYTKAQVKVEVEALGKGNLSAELYDPDNQLVGTAQIAATDKLFTFDVADCALWSAEHPDLYTLEITATNEASEIVEFVSVLVGIREFKMHNGVMCINGKRIVFNGVNRHEFYPQSGRVTKDPADIINDLLIMKDLNINAVRACHYPNNSFFYDACDQIGLYVINETNLETHGSWQALGKDMPDNPYIVPHNKPEWKEAVLARGKAMLERDKNHASILINSCGNEAFGGSVIFELSEYFRQRDPDRLVHYEGLFHDRSYNATSDMESQMYPTVAAIKDFLKQNRDKPFICCEYTHAMGNSCGGMKLYTDLSHEDPLYQGGFIWDFVDQQILVKDQDGVERLVYGGDSGDRPNDSNFCCNGILLADRTYTGKCAEVKYNYQPVKIEISKEALTFTNYNLFTNLNEYECLLTVTRDGEIIDSISLGNLDVEAEATASMDMPDVVADYMQDTACHEIGLLVEFYNDLDDESPVAFEQKLFGKYQPAVLENTGIEVADCFNNVGVKGKNFSYMFSKAKGFIVSMNQFGVERLQSMKFSFFRAPIDNDQGNLMSQRLGAWHTAALYSKCVGHKVEQLDGGVKLTFDHVLGGTKDTHVELIYDVKPSGAIDVSMNYAKSDEMPEEMVEFGLVMKLSGDCDRICYYGKGPFESYVDRDNGLAVSLNQSFVEDEYTAYSIPQECGNHNETRFVEVIDIDGHGVRCEMVDAPFSFSALPWTAEEIENAQHTEDLPDVYQTVLRLNSVHMGIGGDDSWGALPLPQYRLANADRSFKLRLRLI